MQRALTWLARARDDSRSTEGEVLVSAVERRDFDAIYAAHVAFVVRVLRGMGVSQSLAGDAAQDVFMVVHRRLPEFDHRRPVRAWLFAIAYRVAWDYRRKSRRTRDHEPLDERLRDGAPTPEERAEREEAQRTLGEVLDQLDDEKRVLLVLAEIEELTVPEIAALTGIGLNTIYTRLRRARIEFSRLLAARQGGLI
jgi:RNA polymerase sigma-70 factor, ECF subfamily